MRSTPRVVGLVALGIGAILTILTLASLSDSSLTTLFFIIDMVIMIPVIVYLARARASRTATESAFADREPRDSLTHRPD
jgi:energy-converting hydrogenase Eha subunit B